MNGEQYNDFLRLAFQAYLENSPDMIFVKDTNLVYMAASPAFARMVGCTKGEELVDKTDFDIFEEALARKYTEDDKGILSSGLPVESYIEPLPDQNGEKNYSSTSKFPIRDGGGAIIGLYGVSRDVTAEIELEAERESGRLSRQMFDSVLEADLTEDRMLRKEGASWLDRFDLSKHSAFTSAVKRFAEQFVHPDCVEDFQSYYALATLQDNYEKGVDEFSYLARLRVQEKDWRWMEFSSRVYHSRVSNTLRLTTFLRDVDEEVRRREQLQQRAVTDMLTGLRNRESLHENIVSILAESTEEETYALLFVDLDCFKQVNDRWGHRQGDKVLQKTAERLKKLCPGGGIVGRYGGDEFLIFLREVESRSQVEELARKVVEMLRFHYVEYNVDIYVTCSVGAAMCRGGEMTPERLCERADKAMYRAKENGRNQIFFFEDLQ